jgi:hypothetical protein
VVFLGDGEFDGVLPTSTRETRLCASDEHA